MSRIRTISPDFWPSATINKVSFGARLLFIGMWNFADDYGFLLDSDRGLIGSIFPNQNGKYTVTDSDLLEWKSDLISVNLLVSLEYNSRKLLFIRHWFEHQIIINPSTKGLVATRDIETLISYYLDVDEVLPVHNALIERHDVRGKMAIRQKVAGKRPFYWSEFPEALPENFQSDSMIEALDVFGKYKRQTGKAMTEIGRNRWLKRLLEISGNKPEVAIEILDRSMAQGWQGIFSLDGSVETPKKSRQFSKLPLKYRPSTGGGSSEERSPEQS